MGQQVLCFISGHALLTGALKRRTSTVCTTLSFHISCGHCDKEFTQSGHRRQHVQCVHEKKTFYCPKCPKICTRAAYLRKHLRKVHGATGKSRASVEDLVNSLKSNSNHGSEISIIRSMKYRWLVGC